MRKMDNEIEQIKTLMEKIPGIRFGFIDVSLAEDQGDQESEVDIIVLGGSDLVEVDEVVSEAEEITRRPLSITSFTVREFRERIEVKDEAVLRVLKGPKIMLIGDEEEMKTALSAPA